MDMDDRVRARIEAEIVEALRPVASRHGIDVYVSVLVQGSEPDAGMGAAEYRDTPVVFFRR